MHQDETAKPDTVTTGPPRADTEDRIPNAEHRTANSQELGHPDPSKNRRIVEGALLADIAVVLLLGRIYLPIPVVRTIWRLLAGTPFILLAQRQGIRATIMSGIVAYLLMTALVGPTLALAALDTAFAAIIIAAAIHWKWPRLVTAIVGGLIYAACDIVVPAILFAILFRVPISTVVGAFRNGMRGLVRVSTELMGVVNRVLAGLLGHAGPQIPVARIRVLGYDLTGFLVGHWVVVALILAAGLGVGNIFAYHAAADLVLERLPLASRERQIAA
jgi:Predicted membrane protein (DUF2232)